MDACASAICFPCRASSSSADAPACAVLTSGTDVGFDSSRTVIDIDTTCWLLETSSSVLSSSASTFRVSRSASNVAMRRTSCSPFSAASRSLLLAASSSFRVVATSSSAMPLYRISTARFSFTAAQASNAALSLASSTSTGLTGSALFFVVSRNQASAAVDIAASSSASTSRWRSTSRCRR